jgi:hypothetical protein
MKRLIYYVATTNYSFMRRDAKRVAEWDVQRIVPCHGDVIEGEGNKAWASVYEWFLEGPPKPSLLRRAADSFTKIARSLFLT